MRKTNTALYIKPGDISVSRSGEVLKTTLGSCISVCLYDSVQRMGGMNHYIYSEEAPNRCDDQVGALAIPHLIKIMLRSGADPVDLKATIVGGASSFSRMDTLSAGQRNINIAEKMLKDWGIQIVRREVGGCYGRIVRFHTKSNRLETTFLDDCMGHCRKGGESCQYRIKADGAAK